MVEQKQATEEADNALLDSIKRNGNHSVRISVERTNELHESASSVLTRYLFFQYYYAHAPKNFTLASEDGRIYGGDPVLLKSVAADERDNST